MKQYKNPESILVVIYCSKTERFLMLQRVDDANFWQSITGSLEKYETPYEAAIREIEEEIGLTQVDKKHLLIDLKKSITFEIFPQFRHRYAPDVAINREHWFFLILPTEITPILTEHTDYRWVVKAEAQRMTPSWNNAQAINELVDLYLTE